LCQRDSRSFRIALVADRFVNPPPGGLDAIAVLIDTGWGAVQLPADSYSKEVAGPLLEQVTEQTEEFHRRGYDVVLIGIRAGLEDALAAVGVPQPDRIDPTTTGALQAFLRKRPPPKAAVLPD
jgi:hypothetical protein